MLRTTETAVIPSECDRGASPEGRDLGVDGTQNQRRDPSALRSFGTTNQCDRAASPEGTKDLGLESGKTTSEILRAVKQPSG